MISAIGKIALGALLATLCLQGGPALAGTADWAAVTGLAPGDRVQIDLFDGKTLSGTIDHTTSGSVFILGRNQVTEVPSNTVRRLYKTKKSGRLMPTLIGVAIGAGAGGIAAPFTMEHESGYAGAVAGTVALGGAIGGGVGYLVGASGKSTLIYKASRSAK